MPAPRLDPLLTLATTLHATPSSHALLLGAGVSMAAGMPSAWAVQEELIRQLATQTGVAAELPDPHAWFLAEFGTPATYESLLAGLAPKQHERQRLLRGFFEPRPKAEDPRQRRSPTMAHRAITQLVASGSIRVVITLNFDRLVEQALQEAGVHPTVVASAADVAGLPPVHTVNALVVHLHGDYLTATTMRNTVHELAGYEPEVVTFVERLLLDYALIAVGWSATYDHALRELLTRGMRRLFTSYWVEPGELSESAEHLRALQGIVAVRADADTALATLAEAVTALRDREARHPLTTAVAVATVKRGLDGATTAISVHDMLRSELTALSEHPLLALPLHPEPSEPRSVLRTRLQEASRTPAALVAAVAYWGNEATDDWWFEEVARLAHQRPGGGATELLQLPRVCGRQLFCAAAVAALVGRRYALARRLLTATITDLRGVQMQLADTLGPNGDQWADSRSDLAHLALGGPAVERAWEVFELLLLVQRADTSSRAPKAATALAAAVDDLRQAQESRAQADSSNDVDAQDRADEAVNLARQRHDSAVAAAARSLWVDRPHLRVVDAYGSELPGRPPVVGRELLAEVEREGLAHPVVTAGFAGGDAARLRALLLLVCAAVGRAGQEVAYGMLGSHGGIVPSYLWLDTGGTPER